MRLWHRRLASGSVTVAPAATRSSLRSAVVGNRETLYHALVLIVVDEDIADAARVFGPLGTVRLVRGRGLSAAAVADADALVVRSVTRVDAALLAGSPVRFVGTATSGTDHIDTAWLAESGIAFADAAGCNSVTVAEYVCTALFLLARRLGFDPCCKTLGVIGVGRIGSIVARWAEALGMRVLRCDPPLQREEKRDRYDLPPSGPQASVHKSYLSPFSALAAEADIVTLHVPLTRDSPDATHGMVDAAWLGSLKKTAILINTSRGEVVREEALLAAMEAGRVGPVVLDVWCHDPDINRALASRAALATPHVAGYSAESKRRAALMIAEALARLTPPPGHAAASLQAAAGEVAADSGDLSLCPDGPIDITVTPHDPPWAAVAEVLSRACKIESADAELREACAAQAAARRFDEIRRRFSERREFPAHHVTGRTPSPPILAALRVLGFGAGRVLGAP